MYRNKYPSIPSIEAAFPDFQRQDFSNIFKYMEPQTEILVGEEIDLPIHRKTSTVDFFPVLNQNENYQEKIRHNPWRKCIVIVFKSHIVTLNLIPLGSTETILFSEKSGDFPVRWGHFYVQNEMQENNTVSLFNINISCGSQQMLKLVPVQTSWVKSWPLSCQ